MCVYICHCLQISQIRNKGDPYLNQWNPFTRLRSGKMLLTVHKAPKLFPLSTPSLSFVLNKVIQSVEEVQQDD